MRFLGRGFIEPRRLIQGGSRMRRSARTVLFGGRSEMIDPTASREARYDRDRTSNFRAPVSKNSYPKASIQNEDKVDGRKSCSRRSDFGA
jgi:hypothetical protein